METTEILTTAQDVFRSVFDDSTITINVNTTARDIKEWDSLNHIELIVAIEKRFGIRFTAKQVREFKNVGDMCRIIQDLLNNP